MRALFAENPKASPRFHQATLKHVIGVLQLVNDNAASSDRDHRQLDRANR
jgi:hypothetical protein